MKIIWNYFLFQFLPTIYKTTRIFFLGSLPDENVFNIAAQILWLNILYEIITESIIIPVFYMFSKWKTKNNDYKIYTMITIFVFIIYLLFTLIIFFSIESILKISLNSNSSIFKNSLEYIKLEVWGFFTYSIFSYLFLTTTIFRFKNYTLINLVVCLIYTFFSLLLDLFLVTDFYFSLKLSVKGIGINSIVVNSLCSLIFLIYLSINKNIKIWDIGFYKMRIDKHEIIEYIKLFFISCIEVSIRNICFYLMVIRPINSLNDQGIYWITNNFIWSWLLLPISSLSIYIKETFTINNKDKINSQIIFYILFITIIILIWFIFSPLNELFIKNVLGVKNDFSKVSQLTMILLPFYIAFAYSIIVDSIFIKEGKINLYCIQSLIVNLTIYPVYFLFWKLDIWTPTLNSICIRYGYSFYCKHSIILILH